MRVKCALWRYSVYNSGDAEAMLNEMAAKGWVLKRIITPLAYFEKAKPGKERQYTIDFLIPGALEVDYLEDKGLREYYEDMGWEYDMRIAEGMYLFSADRKLAVPRAYVNDEERVIQYQNRKKQAPLIVGILTVMFFCWWCTKIVSENTTNTLFAWGSVIPILGIIFLSNIPPIFAAITYSRSGKDGFWPKAESYRFLILETLLLILLIAALIGNGVLLFTGGFLNHCSGLTNLCAWWSMISFPLFLLEQFLCLALKKGAGGTILITILLVVCQFGAIISPAIITLQFGLW